MHILIEGENYSEDLLRDLFEDPKFYKLNGLEGTLTSVGYYHSFDKNKLVFMLPKVFMKDGEETVLGTHKDNLLNLIKEESIKHKTEYNWVRQLSVYFYNSLIEYRKRYNDTSIIHETETFELNTNLGVKDYSFLDILLSFVNFYKKNKQQILFKHIEFTSNQARKPKWEKTIRKSLPIFIGGKTPIYTEIANRKKVINTEEELITYFFSILNHLNHEHHLNLKIDKSYQIISGTAFQYLCTTGLSKLRKIKYRYFSDVLRRMYGLCEMYFSQYDFSSIKRKREDYMAITNYNLVFEDMVDKLFSDELKKYEVDGVTIDKLKHNDDGKIIDHIYDYKSLIDTSDIFYIGDSKYYKSNSQAGKISKYKQFTYAKNVIQFNIDLLNKKGEEHIKPLRYRDKVTEGYNISPNFFIYGYIDNVDNYDEHSIIKKGEPITSYHFKDRLFDRDTLFVHQYKINFLYVLKSYTTFNNSDIEKFRNEIKETFRNNFLNYFNNETECKYSFYKCNLSEEHVAIFVNDNFRQLNGKCFLTNTKELIVAKSVDDNNIDHLLQNFQKITKLF
ncbi:hypothetical protein [Chryseobacterium sp. YIM B08800]|uniref:hypothetical protein n=1 Tax=Chryseobacterium sp. YIM B08800 TaxID=2984136 RepID=UPI0022405F7C|nr:hypothetical protein [Chryseobacterium sp. YIM B08800]